MTSGENFRRLSDHSCSKSDIAVAASQCSTVGTPVTRESVPGSRWLISSKAVTFQPQEEIAEHSRRQATKEEARPNTAHDSGLRRCFTFCLRGQGGDRHVTMDLQRCGFPAFIVLWLCVCEREFLDGRTEVYRDKGERKRRE